MIEIRQTPTTKAAFSLFGPKAPDDDLRFEILTKDNQLLEFAALSRKEKKDWLAALAAACDVSVIGAGTEAPTTALLKGTLLKQSGGTKKSKSWDKRFFTLRAEKLHYFAHESDKLVKGFIAVKAPFECTPP